MHTTTTALDTYLQRLPLILDKIAALRQLADDHFGHDPEAIHWGHVGDLGRRPNGEQRRDWPRK